MEELEIIGEALYRLAPWITAAVVVCILHDVAWWAHDNRERFADRKRRRLMTKARNMQRRAKRLQMRANKIKEGERDGNSR